jgi:hypothetical protein
LPVTVIGNAVGEQHGARDLEAGDARAEELARRIRLPHHARPQPEPRDQLLAGTLVGHAGHHHLDRARRAAHHPVRSELRSNDPGLRRRVLGEHLL